MFHTHSHALRNNGYIGESHTHTGDLGQGERLIDYSERGNSIVDSYEMVSPRSPDEVPEDYLPEDLLYEDVEEEMFEGFENEGEEEEEEEEEHRRSEMENDKKKTLDRGK